MNTDNPKTAEALRYTVLAVQRQGNRRLGDLLRRINLTPSQAEALEVLSEHGPMTTRAVGEYLLCESGSPSRILSALSEKGLSTRSQSDTDRRATLHALTEEGKEKLEQARRCQNDFNSHFMSTLIDQFATEEEIVALTEKLAKLVSDPALSAALELRFPELSK
ncbi:MarR family winged helix-turn-helix transcriptional regulator [Corynebacterium mastitidis]|uniref:MarR family winged helix-turn-helix transcriptional regulator n=1 Tax=Corynebacterium mastitidis TaxID=161890 RepID=UPI000A039FAB|nr:winged helix DNA-binding protein [Corynebacterium mastitidis]